LAGGQWNRLLDACAGELAPLRWLLILKTYKVADLLDSNGKEDTLIRIITRVVEPTSWEVMGGPGTIDFWPLGNALTVNQTSEVHERIQALLDGFRELREKAPNTKQTKNEGQERQKLEPNASAAQPGQNQSSMGITVVIRANKDAKYVQVAKVVKFLEAKKATKVDEEVNDHPGTAVSRRL
jgi:hypothetical protein